MDAGRETCSDSLLGADGGVISSAESHEEDNGGWSSFVSMTWANQLHIGGWGDFLLIAMPKKEQAPSTNEA